MDKRPAHNSKVVSSSPLSGGRFHRCFETWASHRGSSWSRYKSVGRMPRTLSRATLKITKQTKIPGGGARSFLSLCILVSGANEPKQK